MKDKTSVTRFTIPGEDEYIAYKTNNNSWKDREEPKAQSIFGKFPTMHTNAVGLINFKQFAAKSRLS